MIVIVIILNKYQLYILYIIYYIIHITDISHIKPKFIQYYLKKYVYMFTFYIE